MNVKQLRDLIVNLPDDMRVGLEVTFDEGDGLAQAELESVNVEARCDDVEWLCLSGSEDDEDADVEEEG